MTRQIRKPVPVAAQSKV